MKLIKYDRISSLVSKKTGEEVLETKFNFILLKKINSPVPLLRNGKPFFANWDNSSMKGNIKYCKTPRFLIVEVKSPLKSRTMSWEE